MSVVRRKIDFLDFLDELVYLAAIGDEVGYRHHLEAVAFRKRGNVVETRHRSVVLHNLAAKPDFLKPCKTAEVYRRLGVPRPLQYATFARLKREHMSGTSEVRWLHAILHARKRRHRALRGGYAGGGLGGVD